MGKGLMAFTAYPEVNAAIVRTPAGIRNSFARKRPTAFPGVGMGLQHSAQAAYIQHTPCGPKMASSLVPRGGVAVVSWHQELESAESSAQVVAVVRRFLASMPTSDL